MRAALSAACVGRRCCVLASQRAALTPSCQCDDRMLLNARAVLTLSLSDVAARLHRPLTIVLGRALERCVLADRRARRRCGAPPRCCTSPPPRGSLPSCACVRAWCRVVSCRQPDSDDEEAEYDHVKLRQSVRGGAGCSLVLMPSALGVMPSVCVPAGGRQSAVASTPPALAVCRGVHRESGSPTPMAAAATGAARDRAPCATHRSLRCCATTACWATTTARVDRGGTCRCTAAW